MSDAIGALFSDVQQVAPVMQADGVKPAGEEKGHYTLNEGVQINH